MELESLAVYGEFDVRRVNVQHFPKSTVIFPGIAHEFERQ
jgi:hypothetical protein